MSYRAWMDAARDERIPQRDRLNHMQRDMLNQIFTDKGFIKPGTTINTRPQTSIPRSGGAPDARIPRAR